ncbi:MAG TPA: phosphopantetheine-binding protein [Thermoanaerobaculia bacterium]|jgi:acyl carrier protein|nr:phosphopantetheine-binding protein [Thermoanaerobaculia bacterium]
MHPQEIRDRVKSIIGNVAGLDPKGIGDADHFRDDLNLDSLSLLEIGVDVDMAFQLGLPDERYKEIDSMSAMVELVQSRMAETANVQVAVG